MASSVAREARPTVPMVNPLTQLSLAELRRRTSVKWRQYADDVLPLWVAEMDVPLAAPVAEALHDAVGRGDTGYAYGTGYAEALADFAARRWGWSDLAVDRTALVPDVMLGIVEVLRLLTAPGDAVVVCAPVYPPFYAFVSHADRQVIEAPLGADQRMDLATLGEAFRRARAGGRRAVFLLCNPHNPTGVVHRRAELEAVADLAGRYGVRVVSDEIHAPLVLPGARFVPYLTVSGTEDALAVLSASKAWNLAGLKSALVVAGRHAVADLRRMPEEVCHGPSHLGVVAHTAAFRDGGEWLDRLLAGLDRNRELLGVLLARHAPAIRYHRPEGTYLAWLDCTALRIDSVPVGDEPGVVTDIGGPARLFLDRARVALSSGHVFGTGGAGFVRLNFATSPEILTEAVTRMGHAVTEHHTSHA